MNSDRFLFRAVVEADYCDNDGNEKTIKLLLNDVAVYSSTTIGVTDEVLVNAIRSTNLNAKEKNSAYSYFESNNECIDNEWFVLQAETIEQCTGIKDVNGKFIFEGDIIDYTLPWSWGPGYVYLSMGHCGPCKANNVGEYVLSKNISNPSQDTVYNEWNGDEVIIIGNVHENPELLGERNGNKRFI